MFHGFLNLNKATGMTSHDCISRTRRILKMKKVGHGGTLDPMATGVLPIALGNATRLLQYLPTRKSYRAKIQFGLTTTTDDVEGEILTQRSTQDLSLEKIQEHLPQFTGKISQVPPNFSAIQIEGKRQYELAREGKTVAIAPRTVDIFDITLINWEPEHPVYPQLELEITCGPGTYIRAIARDLGQILGTGATLADLIRTESCGMKLAHSLTFEQLETQVADHMFQPVGMAIALQHLKKIILDDAYTQRWFFGQRLPIEAEPYGETPTSIYVTNENDIFLGIGILKEQVLSPKVVMPRP